MSVCSEKAALRRRVLALRDALPVSVRLAASRAIIDQVQALDGYACARVIAAYTSFGSEVDTGAFLAAVLAAGKALVLPRVARQCDALAFHRVRDLEGELVANAWGIREPRPGTTPETAPEAVEFMLAPGVAFDATGGRLGYGKAYYDRWLRTAHAAGGTPFVVAGAFAVQMVGRVPMEAHDIRVAQVITEARAP